MKFISTRTMSLLAAGALALSLTACGNTAVQTADTTQDTQTTTVTEPAELSARQQDNTRFGRVTAVDGDTVTIAVRDGKGGGPGGMRQFGDGQTPPALPDNQTTDDANGTPPALPDGQTTDNANGTPPALPDGQTTDNANGTPPALPDGQTTDNANGTPPALPDSQTTDGTQSAQSDTQSAETTEGTSSATRKADRPRMEGGEEQTVTLSLSQITKDGAAVTADDITEGTMLKVTVDDSGAAISAQVMDRGGVDGQMGGPRGGMNGQMNGQRGGMDKGGTEGSAADTAAADETANV